jgi:hypothetical protein
MANSQMSHSYTIFKNLEIRAHIGNVIQQGLVDRWKFFRSKPSPIRRTSAKIRSDWSIKTRSRIYNLVRILADFLLNFSSQMQKWRFWKPQKLLFWIIDSRSNSNLASRMHLFNFIQPNILNKIFIKNEFQNDF